ncbi:hypothetical protein YDYSG_45370 [Paenibacillus tyrfis]|nr:hypothetical protein YDYSG_45370 [Paenibacillus tyrfis]GMX65834.1 hypothetical protein Elgi_51050 [Paenibacillus elgii]
MKAIFKNKEDVRKPAVKVFTLPAAGTFAFIEVSPCLNGGHDTFPLSAPLILIQII